MVRVLKVFNAASRPLEDLPIVVHDSSNASAESALAVVTWISGLSFKVMLHANVVADLMGEDLMELK